MTTDAEALGRRAAEAADGFGRCSELLHSAAAALNRPLSRPENVTAEIDALAAWADDIRQRQSAARLP